MQTLSPYYKVEVVYCTDYINNLIVYTSKIQQERANTWFRKKKKLRLDKHLALCHYRLKKATIKTYPYAVAISEMKQITLKQGKYQYTLLTDITEGEK